MGLREMAVVEIWESIKPGEPVLLERIGEGDATTGLIHTINWALSREYRVIIIDILDSFPTLVAKMGMKGFDTSKLQSVEVIKVGGSKDAGKVIGRIDEISEATILSRKFKSLYNPIIASSSKRILTVILGLEKIFLASGMSERDAQIILSHLAGYVGMAGRTGIYIIKPGILPEEKLFLVKLLEDIATTVIRSSKVGRLAEFHIVKSLNRDLEGVLIRV